MSGTDDDFLSRWSRRKLKPAEVPDPADRAVGKENSGTTEREPAAQAGIQGAGTTNTEEAPFDVSSLPSLESIGADTDISAFLRAGVPENLKLAALRRVWVTDPAIRDFKGLQEYDWDFNVPGKHGFGPIGPDIDVKEMVDRLIPGRDAPRVEPGSAPASGDQTVNREPIEPQPQTIARSANKSGEHEELSANEHTAPDNTHAASQQGAEDDADVRSTAKRHGSALPS